MKKRNLYILIILISIILIPSIVYGAGDGMATVSQTPPVEETYNFLVYYLTRILYIITAFAGLVSVVMIMISGFMYITSGGSPEKVTTAKNALTAAIVGLVITLSSWALALYANSLISGGGGSSTGGGIPLDVQEALKEDPTGSGTTLPGGG